MSALPTSAQALQHSAGMFVAEAHPAERCLKVGWLFHCSPNPDYDWGGDERLVKTLAEAFAEALNIEVAEAEELTEVQPTELGGHSGEMHYDYRFDFTDRVSASLNA